MKIKILILLLALAIAGCKTRKVSLDKTTHHEKIDSSHISRSAISTIDTSTIKSEGHKVTTDRSGFNVEIVNDSGTVQHLTTKPDGTFDFTGKARIIRFNAATAHEANTETTVLENRHIGTSAKTLDKTHLDKKVDTATKKKSVTSSIDWGKTIALISLILLVLIIAVLVVLRFNLVSWFLNLFKHKEDEH